MFASTFRAGLGVTALVASGLALGVTGPASADPASTPGTNDYVGVGSDTTQFVITNLLNGATVNGSPVSGYNSTVAAGAPKAASFDACTVPVGAQFPCTPGGDIVLRTGATAIVRPNGSGAGKGLLYGANNNEDVTFARSSSGLNTTEANAGLFAYPFAKDTLVMTTSKNVATHAPAALTPQQVLGIYTGTITNWSQLDATRSGVIKPLIPQTGSGTRSFFIAQLKAINNNIDPSLGANVVETQEHDPTAIQNDANAVAPFSRGRAILAGSVRVETGFSADRALYNVVRGSDTTHPAWAVGSAQMEAIFGSDGFICGASARPLIEAAGFKQLQSVADGGDCGVATQSATSNLNVYNADGTPSTVGLTLAPTSTTYGTTDTATINVSAAAGTPTGSVSLSIGSWTGSATLTSGHATVTVPANIPAGTKVATATYAGDGTFLGGSSTANLVISKATTTTTATFPAKVAKRKRAVGTVTVAISPASSVATSGRVVVKKGTKIVGRGTLSHGTVKITLAKLHKGKNKLVVSFKGTANLRLSSSKLTILQK